MVLLVMVVLLLVVVLLVVVLAVIEDEHVDFVLGVIDNICGEEQWLINGFKGGGVLVASSLHLRHVRLSLPFFLFVLSHPRLS
ncbi:hypothetical protein F5H01DRAFT_355903 [Linnemannia elongata]|nr:hypothetical protein F5H01DRAFT_355903 [Linnemannia elongata]